MTTVTQSAPEADAPRQTWLPPTKPVHISIATAIMAGLGVASVLWAWHLTPFNGNVQSTNDAFVRGLTTVVSPQVSGYVTQVAVQDYQAVTPGQVLVHIDDRIYVQRVAQAQANLEAQRAALANNAQAHNAKLAVVDSQTAAIDNAKAQLVRAEADMARVGDLVGDGAVSKRERDQTFAALQQAKAALSQAQAGDRVSREDVQTVQVSREGLSANVRAAEAQLRLAEIDLANTTMMAVTPGRVGEVGVRLGQYVTNGTQLFSVVPTTRWVIANFREAQTAKMQVGQPVRLKVDGLGGVTLAGHIQVISPAAGSEFSVIKTDNATGNFVKVPQRIGVRIQIDPGQSLAERLRPGMSVEAVVNTGSKP
jgi:multidrug resistance efflux pump